MMKLEDGSAVTTEEPKLITAAGEPVAAGWPAGVVSVKSG